MELLEIVPAHKQAPTFKMLVGRLYNAGVRVQSLKQAFGVARETMRRWGAAVKIADPEQLVQALRGRGGHRKLTPEIQAYVRYRFPVLYAESRYDYSKRMRAEIKKVFGLTLSAETLRPLLRELKQECTRPSAPAPASPAPEDNAGDCARACSAPPAAPAPVETASDPQPAPDEGSDNRKDSLACSPAPEPVVTACHHVGALLFSQVALQVEARAPAGGALLKHWLCAILLGAVNIERTKLLDFGSLTRLLGSTLASRGPQRVQLGQLATGENVQALLRLNAEQVGLDGCQDFYYDPHGKHYTGVQKVLKGWCAAVRGAAKTLYMDFIHTGSGQPVYVHHTDHYVDLRARFAPTVQAFREGVGIEAERVLTFVVDRGLYSYEVFERIIQSESEHVITWQKGYRAVDWQAQTITGSFRLERTRNHSTDLHTYEFEYLDGRWGRDSRMRQVRVQATNPEGRTVQVGVLTDDLERPVPEVLALIFGRWVQENDFWYLDTHFGINQITSYASVTYRRLQGHLEERQMKSGEFQALEQERRARRHELQKLLLQEHEHPGVNPERRPRIAALDQQLLDLQAQMDETDRERSRLEYLVENDYVRLNTRNKLLMDVLKLIARNAFYAALDPFKQSYDNYRDDHTLFRNLTQASGLLVETSDEVEVLLDPTANYPPKLQSLVSEYLDQLNATNPTMPDGSGRRLRFRLVQQAHIQLAIVQEP